MAILRAIVAGERHPYQLAELCDARVHATRQQVAQSPEGNWRTELLFVTERSETSMYLICSELTNVLRRCTAAAIPSTLSCVVRSAWREADWLPLDR
jgi:hypothetical protein